MDSVPLKRNWDRTTILGLVSMTLTICAGCQFAAKNHNVAGVEAFQSGQVSKAINEFQQALTRSAER
ncbi:MAG: hypothetical protein R3C03_19505 [Pirellulaceae bacterium]